MIVSGFNLHNQAGMPLTRFHHLERESESIIKRETVG